MAWGKIAACMLALMVSTVQGYNRLLMFTSPEEYLDICLDGISHKQKPGPESQLFEECSPWKDHACCTAEIAAQLQVNSTWYKLDYNHCPGRTLSDKCRSWFTKDLCFYECSPNVGPWLVKVDGMKIRNEQFVEVPLCQQDCDSWWQDCQDEYTCVENWSKGFNWSSGFPKCPEGSTCRPFREVYGSASNFCEKVFDHSWKVTPNNDPDGCFVMWWEGAENPNKGIALQRARKIVSGAGNVSTGLQPAATTGSVQDYNRLLTFTSPEEYLDICLDGISHKQKPGPESQLFEECSPWKDHACCTAEIAAQLQVNSTWYKLDYNHCPGRTLSDKCRSRFIQDLCFYECSPNVGPWLVKVDGLKIRKERFVEVPLCQQECDSWWEDCQDEYTCVENWSKGFDWSSGFPQCPEGSTCRPFREVYGNASNFCEKVFDHSWKVTPNNDPDGCFVMWWEGAENPNKGIALQRARNIVSGVGRPVEMSTAGLAMVAVSVILLDRIVGRFR